MANTDHSEAMELLTALFRPGDVIELRPLETWTQDGKRWSRPVAPPRFVRLEDSGLFVDADPPGPGIGLLPCFEWLDQLNAEEQGNAFFGVCPKVASRATGQGAKYAVAAVTSLWADLDDCQPDEAMQRIREADLPVPSIVINSGHGTHLYWLLTEPVAVRGRVQSDTYKKRAKPATRWNPDQERQLHVAQIEAVTAGLSRKLGGDHTQDLARLLRLPGFPNVKDARNGAPPTACRLMSCDGGRTYSFDELAEHADANLEAVEAAREDGKVHRAVADKPAISGIVSRLNGTRIGERSETDFGVLCDLIRLGLTAEQGWDLVKGKSKFGTDGRRYFDTSWANAVKEVEATTGRPTDCVLLDPGDPLSSAREFIGRRFSRRGIFLLWHYAGDFYVWTGSHYVICDDQQVRSELYRFLETAMAAGEGDAALFKPTKSKVDNVFDALQALTQMPHGRRPPTWLTSIPGGPNPSQLLPCRNGLLHVEAMKLLPPNPTFFCTHALDVDYDGSAQQPPTEWLRFLTTLWPDDQTSIDALQDWFGYLLLPDTRQHKILLLVGPPRSGKGTIGRVLTALLGVSSVAAPTLAGLQTNFGLAPLIGKPLAIISDARLSGRADQQAIVERLLSISGEDAITIDRKHRAAWTGCLPTRFMIMTNELPRLSDSSGALANRFIVLTLEHSFLGNEDVYLTDKLLTELPQILHWTIAGWRRMQERGHFIQPPSAAEAVQTLADLASPVSVFIRDCCDIGPDYEASAADLFQAWRDYCQKQGREHSGTLQTFGRDLHAARPQLKVVRPRSAGKRERVYRGIKLRVMVCSEGSCA